jgi:chromosomal replication initiator protein
MNSLQPELVWAEVLKELAGSMSGSSFSTWIKPLSLDKIDEVGEDRAIVHLKAESPYVAQQAELRCYAQIKQVIDATTGRMCDLTFESSGEMPEPAPPMSSTLPSSSGSSSPENRPSTSFSSLFDTMPNGSNSGNSSPTSQPTAHKLNKNEIPTLFSMNTIKMPTVDRYKLAAQKAHLREDFTFDSFAVSGSNEMAYAAAHAVAAQPGQAYNPLFLWGGVGVGKTHLMQAIGNTILKANPEILINYCMGEEFLNEIIGAIRTKKTLEFKERYRQLKVLLIDDIQFIAGKDTAQEEFFHTFNAITRAGGQIIMTSDRPPHEIHPLEDRLRSRFEGGLTIDIQQPTFELRTAILLIKSQKMGLDLPMNLAQMVAAEVESTRKLEGVIFKIHSAHRFQNKPLEESLIRSILGSESKPVIERKKLKPSAILRAVTSHFHVSTNTIRGPSRKKEYVLARHIAMYLLKEELDVPYTEIGNSFGGRDHTSVMHAVEKIGKDIEQNNLVNQHVTAIRSSLSSM